MACSRFATWTRGLLVGSTLALAAAVPAFGPAEALPSYDGLWSVVIITNSGSCDRAYRYPVRINNGAVLNDGASLATVSGKVASNGAVTVVVSGGGKTAQGAGRLSGKLGKGSWRGGDCAGVWQAEKRNS
jgi:hypothetical protein